MERANHAALKDRPKALNGLGMHSANNVLLCAMHDAFVRIFAQAFGKESLVAKGKAPTVGKILFAGRELQK
jgi:hypothetical protein